MGLSFIDDTADGACKRASMMSRAEAADLSSTTVDTWMMSGHDPGRLAEPEGGEGGGDDGTDNISSRCTRRKRWLICSDCSLTIASRAASRSAELEPSFVDIGRGASNQVEAWRFDLRHPR